MMITSQPEAEPQVCSKVSAYFKLQDDDQWTVKREKQSEEVIPAEEPGLEKYSGSPMDQLIAQAHSLTRKAVGLAQTI